MIDSHLLNLLPPLRRARGDRLYGPDQRHWVDLWKQDGAWLLGHRPEGAAREWKNQIDKGLGGWAPSLWPRRLEPLVSRLIPGAGAVRVFRNVDRAPAASVWRPWDGGIPWDQRPGLELPLRLVLPSGPAQAVALAFPEGARGVSDHDVTSPAEAASLVQAAAQVLRFDADPRDRVRREALGLAFDQHLGSIGLFERRGIWFVTGPTDYPALFRAHLDAGFLLPPDPEAWGVIPDLSPGEWAAWARLAQDWVHR